MIPRTFLNARVTLLAALGVLLLVTPGCAWYYQNIQWYYCKYLGYPGLLSCIKPPPREATLLPPVPTPDSNQPSREKVALGEKLFFDPILSVDNTISCASCHLPSAGFADPRQVSTGVRGKQGGRNAPTVLNAGYTHHIFWDGRAGSLEHQAKGPILNPFEMANERMDDVIKRLTQSKEYPRLFKAAFPPDGKIDEEAIVMAIAAFERAKLISNDAPIDQWIREEEPMPSKAAERGWKVFVGKGKCTNCHVPPAYTDDTFHNIGVLPRKPANPDTGRDEFLAQHPKYEYAEFGMDRCAFKTPTLRNVRETAPYMHTGALNTLEEVVAFYVRGGDPVPPGCSKKDWRITPLDLNRKEQLDLVEFLKSLSSPVPQIGPTPTLP